MRPRRILHVFGRMARGGAESRTLEVMRHVDPGSFRLDYCALSGLAGPLDQEVIELGGRVHLVPLQSSFPFRFKKLLREESYDVVHSHVHYFSGYILRLSAKAGVEQRICHFRNSSDGHPKSLRRRVQRRIMKGWIDSKATHILAVGEGAMIGSWGEAWREDPRCQVIYNGIDPRRFSGPVERASVRSDVGVPLNGPVAINVARMDPAKNHLKLVSVFEEICLEVPQIHLLLVGRGGNQVEEEVRKRLDTAGLNDRVTIAGERGDVPRLLRACDLFLFPSKYEGLPGAVLEACAAGLPVLASDLPGVLEIASRIDGVHCLPKEADDSEWAQVAAGLLPEEDSAGSHSPAIDRLLGTPFDISICAEAMTRVWSDVD